MSKNAKTKKSALDIKWEAAVVENQISKHLGKEQILQLNINQTFNIASRIMFQLLHVQIFIRLLNKVAILEIAKMSLHKLKNAQFFDYHNNVIKNKMRLNIFANL